MNFFIKSIIYSIFLLHFSASPEARLTLVNTTPYEIIVTYTTQLKNYVSGVADKTFKDAPLILAPGATQLIYHAGAGVSVTDVTLAARGTPVQLTVKGSKGEPYSLVWLKQQVWQDGDRWNWTLWIVT